MNNARRDFGHITRHDDDEPLKVGVRTFRRFSRWMDDELDRLVSRWIHTAAPGAHRDSPRTALGPAEARSEACE